MNFGEINELIQADLPSITQKREVYRAINRVIRDINSKFPGKLHTETAFTKEAVIASHTYVFQTGPEKVIMSGGDDFVTLGCEVGDIIFFSGTDVLNTTAITIVAFDNTVVPNDTINVAETLTADSVDAVADVFEVTTNYTWDNVNYELTLPDYLKELIEVFENGVELENRGYEYVKDSDNSDQDIFTFVGRKKIGLATEIMDAADDICKIKMLKDLDEIASDAGSTDVDIPQQLDQTLISGVMMYLLARPQYKDSDMFAINKDAYEKGLKDTETLEIQRYPSTRTGPKYKY